MAENLGEAQLRLTVDIRAFEESLRQARQLIQQQLGDVTGRPGQTRAAANSAANEINRQQRQQEAADRRRRQANADEQRRIDRAARQGGAREGVRALEIAQEKRFRLARRIDTLEEQGANVARLRVQLGALTEAQSRRQFGSFRQRGQELARQITLEERRLATLRRQERVQRQNAAVGAAMGGARESIFALERAQDRRFKISQRIERLEERGVATQALRRQLGELTTSYAQRQFGTARQLSRELERQVALTEARARRERDVQRVLERTARIGGPREPIQGRLDLPGSPRFLAEQRRREERRLQTAARTGGPRESIRGSRDIPGSPAFLEAQERLRRQILDRGARQGGAAEPLLANERAQQRRFALDQRIVRLQQQGANVGALQIRLAQLDTALADRQFGSARQITTQLSQQVTLTEARLRRTRELQRLTDRAARVGGPSEPIRGRKDLLGSPAFLEEQRRQEARRARQGGPASSLATRASLQSAQLSLGAAGLQLQRQGADVTQIKKLYADLDNALRTGELGTAKQITQQLRDQLTVAREKLAATQAQAKAQRDLERRGGPSLPVSGRLINGRVIPGSPADIARQATQAQVRGPALPVSGRLINGQVIPGSPADLARQRRLQGAQRPNAALGDALIGGAFPLLFGQGLGASLGGSLGGFTGGKLGGNFGFGLSLAGTAVGAQLDAAIAKLGALGSALSNPVEKFSELQQAGVLSSKALEGQVQSLIAVGREAEATALIQRDLAKTYGDLSVARDLAAESDRLNRSWSQLQISLSSLVASPVVSFLTLASEGLKGFADTILFFKNSLPIPKEVQTKLTTGIPLTGLGFGGVGAVLDNGKNLAKFFSPGGLFNQGGSKKQQADDTRAAEQDKARRGQILQLTLKQIAADAQGNTAVSTRIQLKLNELKLEQELARLRLKPNSGPEQQAARENAKIEETRIREQAKAAARVLAAQVKSKAEISNSEKLVTAQLNGYERQSLELEKQLALNERNRQLLALPPELRQNSDQARLIEQQAALRIFEINQRIAKSDEQRWADSIAAANKIAQIQRQTAITAQQRDVGNPGIQALQALEQLRAARDAEREAQARLRVRPGDQALRDAADQAAEQTKAAAESTRQTLIDAYNQAKDAARQIQRSIENAQNALATAQNTRGQGLNEFLSPQQVTDRQQALNTQLTERANQVANRLQNELGINVRAQITGTLEQRNAALLRLIQSGQNELNGNQDLNQLQTEGLVRATNAVNTATAALNSFGLTISDTIPQLITNLNGLISKKWNVTVNVDSKGNVQSFGDLLPSTF